MQIHFREFRTVHDCWRRRWETKTPTTHTVCICFSCYFCQHHVGQFIYVSGLCRWSQHICKVKGKHRIVQGIPTNDVTEVKEMKRRAHTIHPDMFLRTHMISLMNSRWLMGIVSNDFVHFSIATDRRDDSNKSKPVEMSFFTFSCHHETVRRNRCSLARVCVSGPRYTVWTIFVIEVGGHPLSFFCLRTHLI